MARFVFLVIAGLWAGLAAAQQPLSEPSAVDDPLVAGAPADPVAAAEEVALPVGVEEGGEPEFYSIRRGDTLTVSVLEDPNLTRTVLVRPDGRISLPIAGSVLVEGVSPEDLEVILAQRFARGFQITPTVTVSIRGLSGLPFSGEAEDDETMRFYLLGAVPQRGPFEVVEEMTVMEALMTVGGPTAFAAKDRIQIRRRDEDGGEQIMFFDWERLEDGDPIDDDFVLQDGDIVFVPERGLFD